MKRTCKSVCLLTSSQFWPFLLAIPTFAVPIIYIYLTFQCHWHDCGALFKIFNNLFEYGYFHSYDWGQDHFNVHFTPFFYILALFISIGRSLFFYMLLHALSFAASGWLYYKFAKNVLSSSSLAVL